MYVEEVLGSMSTLTSIGGERRAQVRSSSTPRRAPTANADGQIESEGGISAVPVTYEKEKKKGDVRKKEKR